MGIKRKQKKTNKKGDDKSLLGTDQKLNHVEREY